MEKVGFLKRRKKLKVAVVTVGAMFYSFAFSIYCFVLFYCSSIQSTLDGDEA